MGSPVIIEDEERLLRAFRIVSYEKISLIVSRRTFFLVGSSGGVKEFERGIQGLDVALRLLLLASVLDAIDQGEELDQLWNLIGCKIGP